MHFFPQNLLTFAKQKRIPKSLIDGHRFIDLSIYGKPDTIIRLSASIAKIHGRNIIDFDLSIADGLCRASIVNSLQFFQLKSSSSRRDLSATKLEQYLLEKITELAHSYPNGVPAAILFDSLPAVEKKDFTDCIQGLSRKGLIYTTHKNQKEHFHPIV